MPPKRLVGRCEFGHDGQLTRNRKTGKVSCGGCLITGYFYALDDGMLAARHMRWAFIKRTRFVSARALFSYAGMYVAMRSDQLAPILEALRVSMPGLDVEFIAKPIPDDFTKKEHLW